MILSKEYNSEIGVEKSIFDSSNILASFYNENKNELTVIFYKEKLKHIGVGDSYTYQLFLPTDYVWFRNQESQGKTLFEYVKKRSFPFTNNGKYEINDLLNEKNEILKKRNSTTNNLVKLL